MENHLSKFIHSFLLGAATKAVYFQDHADRKTIFMAPTGTFSVNLAGKILSYL